MFSYLEKYKFLSVCMLMLLCMGCPKEMVKEKPVAPQNPRFVVRGDIPELQLQALRGQKRGGMLAVQAEVFNQSTRDLQVYWRVMWLDEAGFQLGDGEVWKQITLLGKQTKALQGSAISPKAVDFKIEISAVKK